MSRLILSLLFVLFSAQGLHANQSDYQESELYSDEASTDFADYEIVEDTLNKKNPAGSKWVRVNCSKNSTCYPPTGFKYRNFNVDLRGSDCRGSSRRRVKMTKDYIITSRDCSVKGSIFVVPASTCRGNDRFCRS